MSDQNQNINEATPLEKLFEALDENGLIEQPDLKSVELAIKKIEVELKYIRKTLKSYRKTAKPTPELLKG